MKRYIKSTVSPIMNEDIACLCDIASDPNTNLDVLEMLKENPYLHSFIAENPNVPVEWLYEFAECNDWSVRMAVARNPKTPTDILTNLSKDQKDAVREVVARNPNTSADILFNLLQDWDGIVFRNAKKNLVSRGIEV